MSAERVRVAVAGAGGMGREALAWLRDARPDVDPVAFFVADERERPQGADVGLAVVADIEGLERLGVSAVVLGIGSGARRRLVEHQSRDAHIAPMSVVHPTSILGPGVKVGDGAILAPGSVLTRDITVSRCAIVNYRAAIGHDCEVGDFAFLGPGAILTGSVTVGADVLVGAGAVVLPGRVVGDGATIGAGAVVTDDVPAGSVVVGNPARPIGAPREGSR